MTCTLGIEFLHAVGWLTAWLTGLATLCYVFTRATK